MRSKSELSCMFKRGGKTGKQILKRGISSMAYSLSARSFTAFYLYHVINTGLMDYFAYKARTILEN